MRNCPGLDPLPRFDDAGYAIFGGTAEDVERATLHLESIGLIGQWEVM